MGRKTFEVEKMVDYANTVLATSTCGADQREGTIQFITQVLMDSGNYGGFRHLHLDEVPEGHLPAIHVDNDGEVLPYPERFDNVDKTRVQFFFSNR